MLLESFMDTYEEITLICPEGSEKNPSKSLNFGHEIYIRYLLYRVFHDFMS
jgi:hypothetical protein